MKHHIIVKWNDTVTDKKAASAEVKELYSDADKIPGVLGAEVIDNCVDRPNRYDLMIRITMTPEALPAWDDSELHHRWKEQYGPCIASKAIFDCE